VPSAVIANASDSSFVERPYSCNYIVGDSRGEAERHDYPVDGVPVPMIFEIPRDVGGFVYYVAADDSVQSCVPENRDVTFDPPLGRALFAEWQGTWDMHADDAAKKVTYRITLLQHANFGAEISFQNPPGGGKRKKNKLTMGPRQGYWKIECDGSVIAGEFKFNYPENKDSIGFRIFRQDPTKPSVYEGTDMKKRKVRLTIETRHIYFQGLCCWKVTHLI